jgi:ferritin-like metal-binding protein YciE
MAQIINVSNTPANTNLNSSKDINLEVGDVFSAKVVNSNNRSNQIVLKLGNGTQINVTVDGQININTNGQNKFLVEGYENGELKVKLLQNNASSISNLDQIIKGFLGNNVNTRDYSMLKALIKYNVPLTKANVLYGKTIMDFQNSIKDNPTKESEFIDNYVASRGINENSSEGQEVTGVVKDLCSQLKNIDNEQLATFMENGIDLSSDNIKSFNNIFKNDSVVFKNLSDIKDEITKIDTNISKIVSLVLEDKLEGGSNIMPSISNVNNQVGIQNKTTRKLSFDVGEVFGARVVSYDGENDETVLKLSDGWKFSAKLNNGISLNQNEFYRFTVQGYEDGKISLKTIKDSDTSKNTDDEINGILKEYTGDSSSSGDATLLKSLIKHGIPLTKDNISLAKSIMDFKESITENPEKEDEFINAYMNSKGLDENNCDVQSVKASIKSFFSELKGFSTNELATFIENGIELTDENIKSFNNVFQNDSTINKELQDIKQEMPSSINNKEIETNPEKTAINNVINDTDKNTSKAVIEEINSKINEMKDTIRQLTSSNDFQKLGMNKAIENLISKLNDFKVFNTMSQNYYCMDVPMNFRDNDYNFKLIIKDDRKSGKKIDSKNVKIATSIKTINMGVVDAYISVDNKNLNIDMKSDEKWTKLLNLSKKTLINNIQNMGYNVNINVKDKEEEFNIVNCRDFFNDGAIGNLDTRV